MQNVSFTLPPVISAAALAKNDVRVEQLSLYQALVDYFELLSATQNKRSARSAAKAATSKRDQDTGEIR